MAEVKPSPVLTMHLTAHINGGAKHSSTTKRIHADGVPTEIYLHEATGGRSSGYRYTARELVCGDEKLDLMQRTGVDPRQWVIDRLPAGAPSDDTPERREAQR